MVLGALKIKSNATQEEDQNKLKVTQEVGPIFCRPGGGGRFFNRIALIWIQCSMKRGNPGPELGNKHFIYVVEQKVLSGPVSYTHLTLPTTSRV